MVQRSRTTWVWTVVAIVAVPIVAGLVALVSLTAMRITDQRHQSQFDEEMYWALIRRDTLNARRLLPQLKQFDPDRLYAGGGLPLCIAIKANDLTFARLLINFGAGVNRKSWGGVTPLADAAWNDSPEFVELLLANGARPNEMDGYGRLPLIGAVSVGCSKSVALLLNSGANPNLRDAEGVPPLMYAAEYGRLDDVKLLLQKGANSAALDSNKRTALDRAEMTLPEARLRWEPQDQEQLKRIVILLSERTARKRSGIGELKR